MSVVHVLVPHAPWRLTPDLRVTPQSPEIGIKNPTDNDGVRDIYQAFLHQLGATDRAVSSLIAQLREAGRWDDTMLVVSADHGISFVPGMPQRHTDFSDMACDRPLECLEVREGRAVELLLELVGHRIEPTPCALCGGKFLAGRRREHALAVDEARVADEPQESPRIDRVVHPVRGSALALGTQTRDRLDPLDGDPVTEQSEDVARVLGEERAALLGGLDRREQSRHGLMGEVRGRHRVAVPRGRCRQFGESGKALGIDRAVGADQGIERELIEHDLDHRDRRRGDHRVGGGTLGADKDGLHLDHRVADDGN
ncbi:MAG: sulfatase-like hydrolase/transferase [Actinomycetota bacterium]